MSSRQAKWGTRNEKIRIAGKPNGKANMAATVKSKGHQLYVLVRTLAATLVVAKGLVCVCVCVFRAIPYKATVALQEMHVSY